MDKNQLMSQFLPDVFPECSPGPGLLGSEMIYSFSAKKAIRKWSFLQVVDNDDVEFKGFVCQSNYLHVVSSLTV